MPAVLHHLSITTSEGGGGGVRDANTGFASGSVTASGCKVSLVSKPKSEMQALRQQGSCHKLSGVGIHTLYIYKKSGGGGTHSNVLRRINLGLCKLSKNRRGPGICAPELNMVPSIPGGRGMLHNTSFSPASQGSGMLCELKHCGACAPSAPRWGPYQAEVVVRQRVSSQESNVSRCTAQVAYALSRSGWRTHGTFLGCSNTHFSR